MAGRPTDREREEGNRDVPRRKHVYENFVYREGGDAGMECMCSRCIYDRGYALIDPALCLSPVPF